MKGGRRKGKEGVSGEGDGIEHKDVPSGSEVRSKGEKVSPEEKKVEEQPKKVRHLVNLCQCESV